jgi:hypothetical protein
MTSRTRLLALATATLVLVGGTGYWLHANTPAASARAAIPAPLPGARTHRTAHYTISSTATVAQTAQVGAAVEALHAAFLQHFGVAPTNDARLQLVLYRDRAQFKAHNTSSPWAEAFYRKPACHAYVADGANPYHWMLHEATHQLGVQVMGLRKRRWLDEGLASYFGVARIEDGVLRPGTYGNDAYPIWWLAGVRLDADVERDIAAGRFIPLRALITDTGPPIGEHVNQYYLEFWSLTQFLFHYDDGRYAAGYRQLIASGGGLAEFERLIGPVDVVQRQWHGYLRDLAAQQRAQEGPMAVEIVEE